LLQQRDARQDIVIELAARLRAVIEARGHSELRAFGTGGRSELGPQSGHKNPPACFFSCLFSFLGSVPRDWLGGTSLK